jgi:GntR family transcriptional regulator
MAVDWTEERPAYKQVADGLRRHIQDRKMPQGAVLPSISKIMADYGVSITVARLALDELRDEGLITTRQGKPAFVRDPAAKPKEDPLDAAMRLLDEVQAEVRKQGEEIAELRAEVAEIRSERAVSPAPHGSRRPRQKAPRPAP